ncbi:MAG: YhcH/YjgK/YiaL family protein [Luteolibacter sp.]|jgi:YhcH/YjgK/YiaL family protein|nr:YhcH/YjgK/YiaL family protein [Luteolibacter sp.]
MILDHLANSARYESLHPLFPAAFAHLRELAANKNLGEGRIEFDGDRLHAMIARGTGKPEGQARMETHRRYIDIQYTLEGCDLIGWLPVTECEGAEGYNETKDLEFYANMPATCWLKVKAGHFAVFHPSDAHAPMANTGQPIVKIVVKVAV